MPIKYRVNKRIDRIAADIGFLQETLGAGDQQILRQDFIALQEQP